MGRVVARRGDEVEPEIGRETEVDGKKQWALKSKLYFDPTKDPMYLRIVDYAPGYAEPTHSHTADELIYILEGDVEIAGTSYKAGDAVWIEANTNYGPLKAGHQGMKFLLARQKPADYVEAR